jgi:hypothetical protein
VPTASIRLSASEKASLETSAHYRGVSVSEYIRECLKLREDRPDLERRMSALEARLEQLEQYAQQAV